MGANLKKYAFTGRGECWILLYETFQCLFWSDNVLRLVNSTDAQNRYVYLISQVTCFSFEIVILDTPFREIRVETWFGDLFVPFDSPGILTHKSSQIRRLQPRLIRKSNIIINHLLKKSGDRRGGSTHQLDQQHTNQQPNHTHQRPLPDETTHSPAHTTRPN